ncbi:MAG TPA: DUF2177 family protein [Gemmatimonadales bacterium]|nr:DUF2177 family protein [Gemmatimonadales bacterium]
MTIAAFVKLYFATLVVFLAIDMVWLGVLAKGFYQRHLGDLLRPDVRWGAALLFYLIFVGGVLLFAVLPALERASFRYAVLLGGLFGMIAYATYDLTNLATLRGFPPIVAVVDMVWGFVLTAVVAGAGYKIAGWMA